MKKTPMERRGHDICTDYFEYLARLTLDELKSKANSAETGIILIPANADRLTIAVLLNQHFRELYN